jgi:hypothetical protein
MPTYTDLDNHHVFLDLSSRSAFSDKTDTSTMDTFQTNRIALKCESVAISTAKNIMSFPTPAVGIATGESVSLGLDLGMATKTISLSGIVTEQYIRKQFNAGDLPKSETDPLDSTVTYTDSDGKHTTVFMTAQEICQLIHSYVDSSFMQSHQNLNKLIILIPSRVGPKWTYHDKDAAGNVLTIGAGTSVENAPLIPFNYAVRDKGASDLDAQMSLPITKFPKPIDTSKNITDGISGFVRSFDTTLVGGQPFVEFSMSFEIAFSSL